MADDPLRHEHDRDDLGVAGREHVEVADERLDELAVRRLEDEQVDAVDLAPEPLAEALGLLEVVGHVDRDDVVGHRQPELDRLDRVAPHVGHRHDDPLAPVRGVDRTSVRTNSSWSEPS